MWAKLEGLTLWIGLLRGVGCIVWHQDIPGKVKGHFIVLKKRIEF